MQQEAFLPIGTVIRDHYVVEDLFGKGEGDLVYLVRDRRAAQNLYVLKERIDPDKQARDRFLVEGVVLKQLRHPALQRVYRIFEENAGYRVYMLMQHIAGQDLETMHRQWPNRSFSLPLTLSLMTPVVEAVKYLHSQHDPVIHRDINPSNIIVPRNRRTVLVNFAINKGDDTTETVSTSFLCSPGYGAPEQYQGETNPSTDLYALAATFYTLLTGLVPPDARKRMAERGIDPLIRADEVTSTVPAPIAEAIHRAMSIRSDERFSSVTQFWQTLRSLPSFQSIKPTVPAITDADTLELQAASAASPPALSNQDAEELHEQPQQSPVGADLSCPSPIYRPPVEDEEASESPVKADVSQPVHERSGVQLISLIQLTGERLPLEIAKRLHSLGNLLSTFPSPYKLLASPRNFIRLHDHIFTQPPKRPIALLLLILMLVLLLSIGTILWPRTRASHNPPPTASTSVNVQKATSTPAKPTPTRPLPSASIYIGTIHDLLANTSTSLSLTGMQLHLGNISGYFLIDNGLQGSGQFEGTFNTAQHIQFVVTDVAGHPIYSFEGGVHPDGNIAGSYCALDQGGQCSGDYGLWSASPATASKKIERFESI